MQRLHLVMTLVLSTLASTAPGAIAQQNVPQPETRTATVFVTGEVVNPGAFQIKATDGVAELIARAGGPTTLAALTKVVVQRADGVTITLDLHTALRLGGAKPDFKLRGGDFITVPRNTNRVMVMGAVKAPGSYIIPEKGTLSVVEALVLAGGLLLDKRVKDIIVLRQNADGTLERKHVAQNLVDLKLKEPLQSNDMVYVSEARPSAPTSPRQAPLHGYFWFLNHS